MKHLKTYYSLAPVADHARLLLAALLLLGLFAPVIADDLSPQAANQVVNNEPMVQFYDIEFEGGNLVHLLKEIMASTNGEISVIWSSDVEAYDLSFPKLSLRNVEEEDLFEVLGSMVLSQTSHKVIFRRSGNVWSVGTNGSGGLRGFNRDISKPMVTFLGIQDVLEDFSLEAVTTAIQTGWELAGLEQDSTLKFHPDTKLLIFKGSKEANDIVQSVLMQLRLQLAKEISGGSSEIVE